MSQNLKYLKYKKKYIYLKEKVSNENILLGGAGCGLDGFICDEITEMEQLKPYFNQDSPTKIFKIQKDDNLTINLIKPVETLATYKINGSAIEKVGTPLNFFTIEDDLKKFIRYFINFKKDKLIRGSKQLLVIPAQCEHLNNFINIELKHNSKLDEKLDEKYNIIFNILIYLNTIKKIEQIEFTDGGNKLQSILDKIFGTNGDNFDNFITELKRNKKVQGLIEHHFNSNVEFSFDFKSKTFNIIFTNDESNVKIFVVLKSDLVYELFTKDYKFNIEHYESYMKFEINDKIFKQKKYEIEEILLPADFTDDLIEP